MTYSENFLEEWDGVPNGSTLDVMASIDADEMLKNMARASADWAGFVKKCDNLGYFSTHRGTAFDDETLNTRELDDMIADA